MSSHKSLTFPLLIFAVAYSMNLSCLHAENVCFLPGDAFFHGTLSQKSLSTANETGSLSLEYQVVTPGNFSGWAGYKRVDIARVTNGLLRNASTAHSLLRLTHPRVDQVDIEAAYERDSIVIHGEKVSREVNPFGVFVYPRNTSVGKVRLAVKYNESWKEEFLKFTDRESVPSQLDEFVKSYECVSESWNRASSVPGLKVQLPDEAPTVSKAIMSPMECDSSEVMLIVTSLDTYGDLFNPRNGKTIYIVDNDKVECFIGKDGQWSPESIPKIVNH